jgi:Protein of unknown function (DUF3168)
MTKGQPMTAATAMQKAFFERLSTDAALVSMLGEGRIFDHVPRNEQPPFIRISVRAVTPLGTSDGAQIEEHLFDIEVWTAAEGRRQVSELSAAARVALDDAMALEPPWTLVNLELLQTRFDAVSASGHYRAVIGVRALTERN